MAITLNKFCVALNHEDPSIVIGGLKAFYDKVIDDHEALHSFGYNGRVPSYDAMDLMNPASTAPTNGLLLNLINSSPQLEEFFTLWSIPSRDEDRTLCAHHMTCMALILHLSQNEHQAFCNRIVGRILHEFTKSIYLQISTGHVELTHATLGLLIAMCRTSKQNACDVFHKVISNSTALASLLQRGKAVAFIYNGDQKINTDWRFLLIILMLTILEAADDDVLKELLANNSLLRKMIATINKDNKPGMVLLLDGISLVQRDKFYLTTPGVKHPLVDFTFQNKLFLLYGYDDDTIGQSVHSFLLKFSQVVGELIQLGKKNPLSSLPRQLASQLVKHLLGHQNLKHREIQLVLLKAQPSLLTQCLATVATSWEPKPSLLFVSSLSHVTSLITHVSSEHQQRAILRSALAADYSTQEIKIKEAIDAISSSIFPPGNKFILYISNLIILILFIFPDCYVLLRSFQKGTQQNPFTQ